MVLVLPAQALQLHLGLHMYHRNARAFPLCLDLVLLD